MSRYSVQKAAGAKGKWDLREVTHEGLFMTRFRTAHLEILTGPWFLGGDASSYSCRL